MQGPTPVSALIHAATMVTAGVYLVARCNVLYALAPLCGAVVAGVGAVTALFAATIALKQWDIKRVLAYSTISQLGYMFVGVGSGAYAAGIFHLATHSFFKALLFLGSGSVIHAMHHAYDATHAHEDAQDMRNMGGLARALPWTATLMWIATLAIAGIPPFAGFFSKDAILAAAFTLGERHPIWYAYWVRGVAAAAAGMFGALRLLKPAQLTPARLAPAERGFARVLWKKWYVDEVYDVLFVRPVVWIAREVLWQKIDVGLVDGLGVNGTARVSRALGWLGSRLQTGEGGFYVVLFVGGVLAVLWTAVR